MKLILGFIFQFIFFVGVCQEVEVLKTSSFKHDYHITDLQYIEDLNDTTKTQFISEIKITGDHENVLISSWFNTLKAKAKESGANLYFIETKSENETQATLIIKLFFAGVNFMKENIKKTDKNKIYLFNQGRSTIDTAQFYLNQKEIIFDQKTAYIIVTKPYQLYNIALTSKRSQKHNQSFPKDAPSVFYMLPSAKKSVISNGAINTQGTLNFTKNKPVELDYNLGKFLLEVYKDPENPDRGKSEISK